MNFPAIGVGASAGDRDACQKVVGAMPAGNGMACILAQHLRPTQESRMVDLLAGHIALIVREASDGMEIELNHLYVIPPRTYCNGMPRSTIATQAVDLVLPVAQLLEALGKCSWRIAAAGSREGLTSEDKAPDRLAEMIDLLRIKTDNDFALYKPDTLQRWRLCPSTRNSNRPTRNW